MKYLNIIYNTKVLRIILLGLILCISISNLMNAQISVHFNIEVQELGYNELFFNPDSEEWIFMIYPDEIDLSNIPICVYSFNPNKNIIETEFALTDSKGIAKIHFPDDNQQICWIDMNGGGNNKKSEALNIIVCESKVKPYLRDELDGESQKFEKFRDHNIHQKMARGEEIHEIIVMHYSGWILKIKKNIENLLYGVTNLDLSAKIDSFNRIIDPKNDFGRKYPKSCQKLRLLFMSQIEYNEMVVADSLLKAKNFKSSLKIYEQLLTVSHYSTKAQKYVGLRDLCLYSIRKQIEQDSLEKECNNIINGVSNISDPSKAITYLKSELSKKPSDYPFSSRISQRIEELQDQIQKDDEKIIYEKEQAEYDRKKSEDERAIKRYKISSDYSQIDFFRNPFAFKGKYLIMQCSVKKFETATSAVMSGGETFYADFKVTPPKKFGALFLIVKSNGTKKLINAYGTPINVPYVDVVHILNMQPEE